MRTRWILLGAPILAVGAVFAACGARTGLPVPDDRTSQAGGGEGGGGSGEGGDLLGGQPPGGGGEGGVGGAPPPDCDPKTTQYVYLVTEQSELFSYNPGTGFTQSIGSLVCSSFGFSPFSMGVDRQGTAYVVYNDGHLFRVSTADASCEDTDFQAQSESEPFHRFGMGFALDEVGGTKDQLYVADINFETESAGLATIDTESLELQLIGPFSENPGFAIEMTSSSDGNLYGFFLDVAGSGGWVVQIDKSSGEILSEKFVAAGDGGSNDLAFAWWGGDFYVFTAPQGGDTTVTRYDPDSDTTTVVTTFPGRSVVGAGVSTCAPGALP